MPRQATQSSNKRSGKSRRGFAAMSQRQRREIASMGGRASHGGRGRDYESPNRSGGSSRRRMSQNH